MVSKMNKIILASHGGLSAGMYDSIAMIIGHVENCIYFGLKPGQDNIELASQVEEYINQNSQDQCVIVCDLLGGSVSNAVSRLADNQRVFVVNGMNMGLVISLALQAEDLNKEMIDSLIEECKMGINRVDLDDNDSLEDEII